MTSNLLKFLNCLSRQLAIQAAPGKEIIISTKKYNEEGYLMSADVVRILTVAAQAKGRKVA